MKYICSICRKMLKETQVFRDQTDFLCARCVDEREKRTLEVLKYAAKEKLLD